nr:MAG TPA: hypothetical protein [Ackermannviridae sp.]
MPSFYCKTTFSHKKSHMHYCICVHHNVVFDVSQFT